MLLLAVVCLALVNGGSFYNVAPNAEAESVFQSCDGETKAKESRFQSPEYPGFGNKRLRSCPYHIHVKSRDVCQVRLDFLDFDLKNSVIRSKRCGPHGCDDGYRCSGGTNLEITSTAMLDTGLENDQMCGYNKGQHMYIHLDQEKLPEDLTLFVTTDGDAAYKWNIKVTQINCISNKDVNDVKFKAYDRCLQYFTEPSGHFMSFNFGGEPSYYVGNAYYSVCFAKFPDNQYLEFHSDNFILDGASKCHDTCPLELHDYLIFPLAQDSNSHVQCGNTWNPINKNPVALLTKMWGPQTVFVHLDSKDYIDGSGFLINYGPVSPKGCFYNTTYIHDGGYIEMDEECVIISCHEGNATTLQTDCKGCPDNPSETSLPIAFDNSGSMSWEADQLKQGVKDISQFVQNQTDSNIYNYALVLFGTHAHLEVNTRDAKEFEAAVDNIQIYGGDEWVLNSIYIAATNSLPNSYIYVFTDEPVSDPHKEIAYQNAEDLVLIKKCHVVFIVTDNAVDGMYVSLAHASGGIVLQVDKNNLSPIFKYIETTFDANRVALFRTIELSTGSDINLLVDATVSSFTVKLEGEDSDVTLTDPDHNTGPVPEDNVIIRLKGSFVFSIPTNSQPGTWTVHIGSSGATAVYEVGVTADATWQIEYGFSLDGSASIGACDTYRRPIGGHLNYMFVKVSDVDEIADLTSITIYYTMDDSNEETYKLSKVKSVAGLYISQRFTPQIQDFDVVVNGEDRNGNALRRTFETLFRPMH